MKTISRMMAVTALVGVAGCGKLPGASLGGTFLTEPFLGLGIPTEGLDFPAQTYSAALAREYQSLARIAANEDVNWIDASAYMQKGYAALRGEQIQPWAPSVLGLSGEIDSVYQRVVTTINANAGRNPVACARALTLYDNYAEELSEGAHACTDPTVILAELDDQLRACAFAPEQTVQRVVVVAPPPPPPVVLAPEPVFVPAPPVVQAPIVQAPVVVAPAPEPQVIVREVIKEVPGPERVVVREVEVPGPERIVERVVQVPAPVPVPAAPVAAVEPIPAPPVQEFVPAPPPPVQQYVEPVQQPSAPLNYTIYFGYDRYDLTAEARQVIDEAVAAFRAYAAPFMDIIGHTDTRGSKSYNTRLAQRRADAVAGAVASRGVDRSSLRVSASSELDPAVTTGDGVREALNRRVTISIVQ